MPAARVPRPWVAPPPARPQMKPEYVGSGKKSTIARTFRTTRARLLRGFSARGSAAARWRFSLSSCVSCVSCVSVRVYALRDGGGVAYDFIENDDPTQGQGLVDALHVPVRRPFLTYSTLNNVEYMVWRRERHLEVDHEHALGRHSLVDDHLRAALGQARPPRVRHSVAVHLPGLARGANGVMLAASIAVATCSCSCSCRPTFFTMMSCCFSMWSAWCHTS